MKNYGFVVGFVYIAFFVGLAYASVGTLPLNEPFPWYLPINVLFAVGFPFVMGFLAGKEEKR
jgi:hypothetical protein